MSIIYHRIKANEILLKEDVVFSEYLKGEIKSTIPKGEVLGITYIPYASSFLPNLPIAFEGSLNLSPSNNNNVSFSQTDIYITNSQNIPLTERVSLLDYHHRGGGYLNGFKKVKIESSSDYTVKISFDTLGSTPICGEFIFAIEKEDECA